MRYEKIPTSKLKLTMTRAEDYEVDILRSMPYNPNRPFGIIWYYKLDWVLAVGLIVMVPLLNHYVDPRDRFYDEKDFSHLYPYHKDSVSASAVAWIVLGFSTVSVALVQCAYMFVRERWLYVLDFHHFWLGFVQTMAVCMPATFFLKKGIGRLRPSAMERLQAGEDSWNMGYPSGHTSFAFCAMTYLAFYLSGKLGIFREDGLLVLSLGKTSKDPFAGSFATSIMVIVLPMSLAMFVAASRIFDYAHDFSDINMGVMIGMFSAAIGYFCNFTSPFSRYSYLCRPAFISHRLSGASSETDQLERELASNDISEQSIVRT